jgi:hypothetical protein
MAAVLADVACAAPPGVQAFHPYGMADAEGFIAMGRDEMLVHAEDLARTFGLVWQPPEELCRRILVRLFPWAAAGEEPWLTLRWANGRTEMARHPRLGPDWAWQSEPLSEWDGTIRKIPATNR